MGHSCERLHVNKALFTLDGVNIIVSLYSKLGGLGILVIAFININQ